jgi:hypothetical protein
VLEEVVEQRAADRAAVTRGADHGDGLRAEDRFESRAAGGLGKDRVGRGNPRRARDDFGLAHGNLGQRIGARRALGCRISSLRDACFGLRRVTAPV